MSEFIQKIREMNNISEFEHQIIYLGLNICDSEHVNRHILKEQWKILTKSANYSMCNIHYDNFNARVDCSRLEETRHFSVTICIIERVTTHINSDIAYFDMYVVSKKRIWVLHIVRRFLDRKRNSAVTVRRRTEKWE